VLELNPADMGPVTVQIQLEGTTAQVHLAADQAATRQALTLALPQLAGSLREAGLMLAGGGVFEQPRQAPQDQGTREDGRPHDGGVRSLRAPQGPGNEREPTTAVRRRGVVDLLA
jgi:flagellar hook-length control protein FliK